MILYPETALAVKPRYGLECLLTMEMARYLCWHDRPVAGAKPCRDARPGSRWQQRPLLPAHRPPGQHIIDCECFGQQSL